MIILVTGAAGRMGAHLTRRLSADGHTVRAFVLPDDPNNQAIDGPNVEIVPGRLEDRASVDGAVAGVDAVVALAGALTSRLASDQQFFDANLGGTFNLLMAARLHAPDLRRFVYASSDAVYWSGATNPAAFLPVDESHPRRPGSIYGATKLGAEELCLTFMRAYGIPATIIRPTATTDAWELVEPDSVFGRRMFLRGAIRFMESQPNLSADEADLLAALRARDDGTERLFVLADPEGRVSTTILADARDTAAGLHLLLTRPEAVGEAFNIGPAAPHGEEELVAYVAERLRMDYVVIRRPAVRPSWYVSSAKARGMLGYEPTRSVFQMVDEAVAAKRARAAAGS
ncbi:MAG TPA: NAD(P)-dependent oxidoreductase [Candidatus Saccharimonadales bacterium]|nr:NAD(P)-dependent oxidoreductase [Candidatus Saccharimonadales bacterium]